MKTLSKIINRYSLFLITIMSFSISSAQNNLEQDKMSLQQLIEDYKLWSITEKPYKIEKIEHLYDHTDRLLAFDLMSPKSTVIKGWDNYQALWSTAMQNFNTWTVYKLDDIQITIDQNMALTTLLFSGKGTLNDGSPVEGEFHSTLVWLKKKDEWKIIHEHISGPVKR